MGKEKKLRVRGTIKTLKIDVDGAIEFTINPKDKINKIAVSYGDKPSDIKGISMADKIMTINKEAQLAPIMLSLYQNQSLAIFEFTDNENGLCEFSSIKVPADE